MVHQVEAGVLPLREQLRKGPGHLVVVLGYEAVGKIFGSLSFLAGKLPKLSLALNFMAGGRQFKKFKLECKIRLGRGGGVALEHPYWGLLREKCWVPPGPQGALEGDGQNARDQDP